MQNLFGLEQNPQHFVNVGFVVCVIAFGTSAVHSMLIYFLNEAENVNGQWDHMLQNWACNEQTPSFFLQVKKHIKQGQGHEGGIFTVEAPLHASNVQVLDPVTGYGCA